MDSSFLFVALLALGIAVRPGGAIKCYQCTSLTDSDCGDPANLEPSKGTECTSDATKTALDTFKSVSTLVPKDLIPGAEVNVDMSCFKMKSKEGDKEVVVRLCHFMNFCENSKNNAVYCGKCDSDLCNGAGPIDKLPALLYALLPCFIAIIAFRM